MSIPLVQNNEKDSINTSIIAIKRNIERINMLLGLVDSGSPDLSGLATKQELEDAITQVETDLAPVDEVTSGNMQSVTSNAVAGALENGTEANKVFTQNGKTTFYGIQKWGKLRICTVEIQNPTGSGVGTFNSVVLVNDTGFRPVAGTNGLIVNVHSSTNFHGKVDLSTTGKLTLTESWGMTSGNSIAYAVLVWVEV